MKHLSRKFMLAAAIALTAASSTLAVANNAIIKPMVNTLAPKANGSEMIEQMAQRNYALIKNSQVIDASHLDGLRNLKTTNEDETNWETLISEDFSKWTKGSEDEPDATMYPTNYFNDGSYVLPDSLFNTTGWSGLGLYEAGGNVALAYPNLGGMINTCQVNMQGRIRIKLRCKAIKSDDVYFFVSLCCGDWVTPIDPIGNQLNIYKFNIADGWQDVVLEVTNPYGGNDCFIQVNAMVYNKGNLIIDSIKVERDKDGIFAPSGLAASKFVIDGFTASWDKAFGADSYLLNVYEYAKLSTDNYTGTEDFNQAALSANNTISGMSDGWFTSVITDTKNLWLSDGASEGEKSMVFTNVSDTLYFELPGSYILDASLKAKAVSTSENSYAMLYLQGYSDAGWINMSLSSQDATDWTTLTLSDDDYYIPGQFSKLRIVCEGMSEDPESLDKFAIDDLVVETTPRTETRIINENLSTNDVTIALSGLNLNNEHFFTVQSVNSEGKTSSISAPCLAIGVAAPVLLEPTDLNKRGAYTANWEAAINASSYELTTYQQNTITSDQENYVVFEEHFNKCTDGTVESPIILGNVYSSLILNDYSDNPGWIGLGNTLANGMVGCDLDYFTQLYMISPEISLNNNNGIFNLSMKVTVTDEYGTTFYVQCDESSYAEVFFETPGTYEISATFKDGKQSSLLMFYTYYNSPFFIDDIVITQDLKHGDVLNSITAFDIVEDAATSCRVSDLKLDSKYTYAYSLTSIYDRFGVEYRSEKSPLKAINFFNNSAVESIESSKFAITEDSEIYDLSGHKIKTISTSGIYIIKNGSEVRKMIVTK